MYGGVIRGWSEPPRVLQVWHTSQSINGPQSNVLVQTRSWASCNFTRTRACVCVCQCQRQSKSQKKWQTDNSCKPIFFPLWFFPFLRLISQISLIFPSYFSTLLASLSFYFVHATVSHFFLGLNNFALPTACSEFVKQKAHTEQANPLVCLLRV